MATIRATFVLRDRASRTLRDIDRRAQALDKRLKSLDDRLTKLDRNSDKFTRNWERNMSRWERNTSRSIDRVNRDFSTVQRNLDALSRKRFKINVDADVAGAITQLSLLRAAVRRSTRGGTVRAGASGAAAGAAAGTASGVAGLITGGIGQATANFGRTLDRIGVNIGPISTRLSMLVPLLLTLAPPVLSAIAAGISAIAGAIGALSAAAVAATSVVGAFATGILAIGVPIFLATKRIMDKREALSKAIEKLDKYKAGTDQYKQALKELTAAQKAFNSNEGEINRRLIRLSGAWERLVVNGKSGDRAIKIINESLKIAEGLLPTVANQMDRFTAKAVKLFETATENEGPFRRLLEQTMRPWPTFFDRMTRASGNFLMGFIGMLRAANPLASWMSASLLEISENFNEWVNSRDGQRRLQEFFRTMRPIIEQVVGFIWDLAAAIIEIAEINADTTVRFFEQLRDFTKGLVPFISQMTDDFQTLWPTLQSTFILLRDLFLFMAPAVNNVIDGLGALSQHLAENETSRKFFVALSTLFVASRIPIIGSFFKEIVKGIRKVTGALLAQQAVTGGGGLLGFGGRRAGRAGAAGAVGGAAARGGAVRGAAAGAGVGASVIGTGAGGGALAAIGGGSAIVGGGVVAAAAAVIIAAAASMWMAWKENTNKIREHVAEKWGEIKENLNGIWSNLQDIMAEFGFELGSFQDTMNSIWDTAKELFPEFGSLIIEYGVNSVENLTEALEGITRILKGVIRFVKGAFTDDWSSVWIGLTDIVVGAVGTIKAVVEQIWNIITTMASAVGISIGDDSSGGSFGNVIGTATNMLDPGNYIPAGQDGSNFAGPPAPKTGDGFGDKVKGAGKALISPGATLIGKGAQRGLEEMDNQVGNLLQHLAERGILGNISAHGVAQIYRKIRPEFDTVLPSMEAGAPQGTGSVDGLSPAAAAIAGSMGSMFGVTVSSGLRPGATTEFGNPSLHGMGRAVDLVGTPEQMRGVWNALLGRPGIQELIYAGMASYNGGPPVPFTGSNKHFDHVHVGVGDGVGAGSAPGNGSTSMDNRVNLRIENMTVSNGQTAEDFVDELAEHLERLNGSSGSVDMSEMVE